MIGFLRGLLMEKTAPSLLLDVKGVGYEVEAPMSTFYNLPESGHEVMLYTHLVVREDAHTLFGFSGLDERALFRSLIRVNGVGARLALTILSGVSVEEFHRCVSEQDSATLVRMPGIGKKTAERLIIEMQDRLPGLNTSGGERSAASAGTHPGAQQEAISALTSLGYKREEANRLVQAVSVEGKSSEDIIRVALRGAVKNV